MVLLQFNSQNFGSKISRALCTALLGLLPLAAAAEPRIDVQPVPLLNADDFFFSGAVRNLALSPAAIAWSRQVDPNDQHGHGPAVWNRYSRDTNETQEVPDSDFILAALASNGTAVGYAPATDKPMLWKMNGAFEEILVAPNNPVRNPRLINSAGLILLSGVLPYSNILSYQVRDLQTGSAVRLENPGNEQLHFHKMNESGSILASREVNLLRPLLFKREAAAGLTYSRIELPLPQNDSNCTPSMLLEDDSAILTCPSGRYRAFSDGTLAYLGFDVEPAGVGLDGTFITMSAQLRAPDSAPGGSYWIDMNNSENFARGYRLFPFFPVTEVLSDGSIAAVVENSRLVDGEIQQYHQIAYLTLREPPSACERADIFHTGQVDTADLSSLLRVFGKPLEYEYSGALSSYSSDLNADFKVDTLDLLRLLQHFDKTVTPKALSRVIRRKPLLRRLPNRR